MADSSYTEIPDIALEEGEDDEANFEQITKNLMDMEEFAPTPLKPIQTTDNVNIDHEQMKVYLRIRPFTKNEETQGENQDCMELENDNVLLMHAPKDSVTFKNSSHGCGKTMHRFTFSKIFDERTTQKTIFDKSMLGTVKDLVNGQNCLVFTYGVTNAGKTYTIQGNPRDGGILPRALDVLFNSIQGRQWESMSLKPKMFSDVVKIGGKDLEKEEKLKESIMNMATDDEPDVSSLLGDSQSSTVTNNSGTTLIEETTMETGDASHVTIEDKENLEQILKEAEDRVREEAAFSVENQGQIRFAVWVTFAEIYNEYIYDLLEPLPKKKNARRTVLKLSEDKNGSPYIRGLKMVHVTSADEAYKVLTIGKKNLQMACTKLNHNSSRSHCIFTIKVLRVVDKENPHMARVSMLSLCDLAGSERYSKTHNCGERLKEAGNINTSLLTLGRCIGMLRYNQSHKENQKIIPFRESKLTRLFQTFFSGKGKASMIVNVNQCASLFDETLHGLKFSAIAKHVTTVQEPEKPKYKPPPKKMRLLSLYRTPGGRASISWATPGTMAEHMQSTIELPIPEETDSDLDDTEVDREQEFFDIIEQLKNQLTDERRKAAVIEVQIREEVCQEFAQQLVEIENTYTERLREEQMAAEEKAEKRIEMYTATVKKSCKRPRLERKEDDGEEWISSVVLHAEKVKVEERDGQISDLQTKLCSLREDMKSVKEQLNTIRSERDQLQAKNSQLQFELAETKSAAQPKEVKQEPIVTDLAENELIEALSRQLQEAKSTITTQASEMKELNEMLTEAGETFTQKDDEITKLKDYLEETEKRDSNSPEDLEKMVVTLKKTIDDANEKLTSRDDKVVTLQKNIAGIQDEFEIQTATVESLRGDIEFEKVANFNLTNELTQTQTDLIKTQEQISALDVQAKEQNEKIESMQTINSQFMSVKNDLEGTVKSLSKQVQILKMTKNTNEEKSGEISQLQAKMNLLQESLASSNTTNETYQTKIMKLEESITEYKSALADHEVFVGELNKQLKDEKEAVKIEKEAVEVEKEALKRERGSRQELDLKIEQKDSEMAELKDTLELEQLRCNEVKATTLDLQTKIEGLEVQLSEEQKISLNYAQQLERLTEQMAVEHQQLDETGRSVKTKEKEREKLHRQLSDLKRKFESKQREIATMQEMSIDIETSRYQLEETLVQKEGEIKNLRSKIASKQSSKVDRQLQDTQSNKKVEDLSGKLKEATSEAEELKSRINLLESDIQASKETAGEYKAELKMRFKETEDLKKTVLKFEEEIKNLTNTRMSLESFAEIGHIEKEIKTRRESKLHIESLLCEKFNRIEELQLRVHNLECELECKREREVVPNTEEVTLKVDRLERELESKQHHYEQAHRKIADLEADIDAAQLKISSLETDLRTERKHVSEARSKVAKLQSSNEEVTECKMHTEEKVCVALQENETLQGSIATLKSELECTKTSQSTVTVLKEQISQLKNQVSDANRNIETLKKEVDQYSITDQKLKTDLENRSTAIEELNAGLSKQGNEIKQFKDQNQKLTVEMEEKNSTFEEIKESLRKKLDEKELLSTEAGNQQINQLRCNLEEKDVNIEELKKKLCELKQLEDQKQKLAEDLDNERDMVEDLTIKQTHALESLESVRKELAEEKIRNHNLTEIFSDLTKRGDEAKCAEVTVEQLKQEQVNYEKTSLEAQAKISDLEDQLEKLGTSIEQQTKEIETLKQSEVDLKDKNQQLGSTVADEQILSAQLKEMEAKLVKENKDYSEQLSEKGQIIDLLEKLEVDFKTENQELKGSILSQKTLVESLQQTQEKLVADKNELNAKIVEQETLLESLKQTEADLIEEKTELTEKLSKQNEAEDKLIQESLEKDNKLNTLNNANEQLKSEIQGQQEELNKSKELMENLQEKNQEKIESLTKLSDKLSEEVVELRQVNEELKTKLTSDRGNINQEWQVKLEEKMKECEKQWETKIGEINDSHTEVVTEMSKSNDAEVDSLNEKIVIKDKALEALSCTATRYQDEIGELRGKIETQTSSFDQGIQEKDSIITELKDKNEELTQTVNSLNEDKLKSESNEALVSNLKVALEEQEKAMCEQDELIVSKEEEISRLVTELDSAQAKLCDARKESSKEKCTQIKDLLARCQELEKETSSLTKAKKELTTQTEILAASNDKLLAEKTTCDTIIFENSLEMKELEKLLSESREKVESLTTNNDEIVATEVSQAKMAAAQEVEKVKTELKSVKKELREHDSREMNLNDKIREKSKALKDSEQILKNLKADVSRVQHEKETELKKFRDERDKLADQIKGVLERKDEELNNLKGILENKGVPSNASILEDTLRTKDAIISQLEQDLEVLKENQVFAAPPRRTRGKRATCSTAASRESTEAHRELAEIQKQTQVEQTSATNEITFPHDVPSSCNVEIDVTPLQSKKRVYNRRKRRSNENENKEQSPPKARKYTRRRKTSQADIIDTVDETENRDPVPQENSRPARRSRAPNKKSSALEKIGEFLGNSPLGKSGREAKKLISKSPFKSPAIDASSVILEPEPATKKKRKLYKNDISSPLDCPPLMTCPEKEDVHKIVTRKLRSRRN